MIRLFTSKLPAKLSRDLYFEYNRLLPRVKEAIIEKEVLIDDNERDFVFLLLAMSIFFKKVIMPLSGAESFSSQLSEFRVETIQMSSFQFTNEDRANIDKIVKEFYGMINSFGIDRKLLDYSDSKTFLDNSLTYIRNRENNE